MRKALWVFYGFIHWSIVGRPGPWPRHLSLALAVVRLLTGAARPLTGAARRLTGAVPHLTGAACRLTGPVRLILTGAARHLTSS